MAYKPLNGMGPYYLSIISTFDSVQQRLHILGSFDYAVLLVRTLEVYLLCCGAFSLKPGLPWDPSSSHHDDMMEGLKDLVLLPRFRLEWLESLGEYVHISFGHTHYLLHFLKNGLNIVCFYSVSSLPGQFKLCNVQNKKMGYGPNWNIDKWTNNIHFYHFQYQKMILIKW